MDELVARWRRVEAMGFDALWVADHLTQFPGAVAYEAWTLLAAMARETQRVRIGPLVTPIAFRHPTVLAMAATTVDHLSAGRLELGLGAGGGPKDQASLGLDGWSNAERLARLEEQVTVVDALLRGETVTYEGRHYRVADATLERPIQRPRPPLVIAAQAARAMRVVARFADTWNTLGGQPTFGADRLPLDEAVRETRRQMEALDDACAGIGRDPATLRRSLFAYRAVPFASLDAFTEIVSRYREIGITDFSFAWPSAPDPKTAAAREAVLERAAAEVIPKLRGAAV